MAQVGNDSNNSDGSLSTKVNIPEPSVLEEVKEILQPIKSLLIVEEDPFKEYRNLSFFERVLHFLVSLFPILDWLPNYKLDDLFGDLVGGLTISSLAVPQDLGYAKLANLPPVNGLYSSFVPPLIYAAMGTSRHIAIGPVAVVSLLLGNLLTHYYDPKKQAAQYYTLAITSTFFTGIIQLAMGLFRLGFIIEFLSHPAIVGFMGGAAITIGLRQMKGLLGYSDFTTNTDVVSVTNAAIDYSDEFNWETFVIGMSFLGFLLTLRTLNWYFKKTRIFFYLNTMGPIISIVVSTACVYATRADLHGVNTVGTIKKGVNPSSVDQVSFSSTYLGDAMKIAIVAGLIALTEEVAIARTFASLKGYHINGNQEMLAMGAMNIVGSMTSCYISTGSFSRSAVNFNAGGNTMLTNIIMSAVILVTLVAITPLFKYLPNAVLSAIIINAVWGLVDIRAAAQVFHTDKLDFIVLLGAFFGVIFISIEIGLLISVSISIVKLLVQVTRPHLAHLGLIPGTSIYRNVAQYSQAITSPGIAILRIDSPLYFPNANYIREKLLLLEEEVYGEEEELQFLILDLTAMSDIDSTGIHAMEETHRLLQKKNGVQLALSNPSKLVMRKLQNSGFLTELGHEWLFLSTEGAVIMCTSLQGLGDESAKDGGESAKEV